ncbi:amino acid/amide ABC transporter substrate-binding protein, HAAT family [Crinalium epipsammum PCC 9333]|uniref:Amino acid/amide ABC transporter substrate-binding protein, HAAT family n=1 Tax=Crinalium epipsammum PCC 9333 TaxID=1173022 RepID=K9VXY0_9CYAN|nr:ABC transporter substrate-binding protein [Crinalium epipsammum]AFZ12973.1 amino acid/amide ABC transporter substrate-binding protein, HAAT family [Crinalium epipsammum PCC 9333]
MSQKKETTVLVLSLIITLAAVSAGFWWLTNNSGIKLGNLFKTDSSISEPNKDKSVEDRISLGDKILISGISSPPKQAGVEAIASKNYQSAIANFQAAIKVNRNDPEALIFLNNARIENKKSYTIAVLVPIGSDVNSSLEMLRGVAQAQNEINSSGGVKGVSLKVAIANDENNPEIAKKIATTLVQNSEVLGVVGAYASDVTLAAGSVFQSGQLVAISPTSTSVKLSSFGSYIFRTVPSDYVAARALANYMVTKLKQQNVAVFFNSKSSYSQSLKSEFVTAVSLSGGQVKSEFDLSQPNFSAAKSIEQATKQQVKVLMLASNTDTLDKALQVVQINRKQLALLAGDDAYTPKTLEVGGESAVGMVVAVPWHIDAQPNSVFARTSRSLWDGATVNWRTALAYDATEALIKAIERNPTRTGIQQALSSPDFSPTGASGSIGFLASGDRNSSVQLVKIVPGNRSGTGYDFVPVP